MWEIFENFNHPIKNMVLAESLNTDYPITSKTMINDVVEFFDNANIKIDPETLHYHMNSLVEAGFVYTRTPETATQGRPIWYILADPKCAKAAKIVNKWSAKNKTDIRKILRSNNKKEGMEDSNLERCLKIMFNLDKYGEHNTTDLANRTSIPESELRHHLDALKTSKMIEKASMAKRYSFKGDLADFYLEILPNYVDTSFELCQSESQFIALDTLPGVFTRSQKDSAVHRLKQFKNLGLITATGKRNKIYQPIESPDIFTQNSDKHLAKIVGLYCRYKPVLKDFFVAYNPGNLSKILLNDFTISDIRSIIGHPHSSVKYLVHLMLEKGYAIQLKDKNKRAHTVHSLKSKGRSFVADCMIPVYNLIYGKQPKPLSGIVQPNEYIPEIDYSLNKTEKRVLRSHLGRKTKNS